ncbi:uncharacterized protein LOC121858952 isoform X2 [Homarus americanus]|uniref:uncharacterized protein LOC121858952 isoform X2 n=1 Tax=Homarus americanus TaxID=6706 RepID=UPI001C471DCB|nr:uncharacterized protein LOC121858952 isoform X2 [Homarus americanus]
MYTQSVCLAVVVCLVSSGNLAVNDDHHHDHILCRKCGTELTENTRDNFVNVTSPLSESTYQLTVLGHSHLMVQTLRNPADVTFNLVAVKRSGCSGVGEWHSEHTWFPSYQWKVCLCPRCEAHLGWIFEPKEKASVSHFRASSEGFYGLILEKLITERFSDSLLVGVPKFHKY